MSKKLSQLSKKRALKEETESEEDDEQPQMSKKSKSNSKIEEKAL